MNRSTFALFVAVLVHLLLFLLLWILFTTVDADLTKHLKKPKEQRIKISLKEVPKKYKQSGLTKKKIQNPRIAPPMPKGSQLKKIVQRKKQVKFEPKKPRKKPKLNKPKKIPKQKKVQKPKIEPIPPTKPYIPYAENETNTTKTKQTKVNKELSWL